MLKNKIKIIDCTLRDGGYYNNWLFDTETVNQYLYDCQNSKIDIIELGFRFLSKDNNFGPYAYSTDNFLSKLNIKKSQNYSVMINASEYLSNSEKNIELNFDNQNNSPIKFVRLAINIDLALKTYPIINSLKKKGYKVALNLMQPQKKNSSFLKKLSKKLKDWGVIDVLYFADSLGCLDSEDINFIALNFNNEWKNNFGFHAHNNKSLALTNTLIALQNNLKWVDSTIKGMGRGAGNLQTEIILSELNKLKIHNGNPFFLQKTLNNFKKIQQKYEWGPSIYYHFAANHFIHPTYVQTLLSDSRYNMKDYDKILNSLSKSKSTSFDKSKITNVRNYKSNKEGNWDPKNKISSTCTLIASSSSTLDKIDDINLYLNKNNFDHFTINYVKGINYKNISKIISANPMRILYDHKNYTRNKLQIITSKQLYLESINKKNSGINIHDYSFNITSDKKKITSKKNECFIQNDLSFEYALAILARANVKNIYLIGFEGYDDNYENNKINEILELYKKKYHFNIKTLTKSKYNIPSLSIYSLI